MCRGYGYSISREQDDLLNKLIFIAAGNVELVNDAICLADRAKKKVRCGFLWLDSKEIVTDAADLSSVVKFIEKNRDTHDGHPMRRQWPRFARAAA